MRRTVIALVAALCLWSQPARQPSPDAYRSAYRAWREAEPDLERDAAAARETLTARASHAADEAAKYAAARADFLGSLATQRTSDFAALRMPVPPVRQDLAPSADYLGFVATQTSRVAANISAFANDRDPGIQQLRQALEREQSALAALGASIADRQKAEDKAAQQAAAAERSRAKAVQQIQPAIDAIAASAASVNQEGAAWAAYYQALAEASRVPMPVAAPVELAPAPRIPITFLPLTRYTGAWTYSAISGMFHGAEPEFLDLVVHEEDGRATGTLKGRFKLPPGSSGDPAVQFSFSGDFQPDRIQTFTFITSEGAKGTIDLIPGNESNRLEASFQIEPRPGKIRMGDLLLVKQ